MPIYEYACGKCEHEFEVEQRISDDPIKTCPSCRSRKVKKLISKTSFVLKGSGWYSDLYSSSKKDAAPGEGKSEGADGGKDEKSAAKGDAAAAKDSDKSAAGNSEAKAKKKGKPKAA